MDENSQKEIKRKSKKRGVKKLSVGIPSSEMALEEHSLSDLEKININNLLSQIMLGYDADKLSPKKEKLKDVSVLSAIIEEYLSCFVLVGFSLNNEKVLIFNAQTSKDEAAVVDYLRTAFVDIMNNRN